MAGHSDAPDLNSVLQALSSLAPQGSSSQIHETNPPQHHVTHPPRTAATHAPRPAYPSSSKPGIPTIDPTTITTWDEAKRYLKETVRIQEEAAAAQAKEYGNEKEQKKESPLILRIRRLIKEQHDYERRWWEGRQALLQRQQTRGAKKKS
ncbi:hypothetical protein N7520_009388 [Penicillium odoratum]|uniref:uncharacterized protein n=1 Tax=Penicillium odoratum TaxID=1167516 RepID=UPI002547DD6C|nr:uncharacterized protein N7520_009388 [Penicillium odoratum]KAJ5752471.1 hypothetical protein N7520_009388 [Penicillium odoratum]